MRINILSKPKSFQIFIAIRPLRETGAAFFYAALRAEGDAPGYKYGAPLGRDRSVSLAPPLFRGRSGGGNGRAVNLQLAPALNRSENLLPY